MDLDNPPNPAGDRTLRLAALICAVLLALAALWVTRRVMTPVAFALFIIALVWPLQRRLKTRLPQLIEILLTAVVALFAIGVGCWLADFFWAMLWGIAGAFIGVPILIALASLCARNPATRGIAIALSADAARDDRADR